MARLSKSAFILLLLNVIFILIIEARGKLYDPTGDVAVLDQSNYAEMVYNSDKAWFVEFYSSWCGHCVHFAPTWKSFAEDLRLWKHVAQVAAVDCASTENTELCRSQQVHAYPSIKWISTYTKPGNVSAAILYKGTRTVRIMREYVAAEIETLAQSRQLHHWPNFHPADASWVTDFFSYRPWYQFLVIVFQGDDNFAGKEIILDVTSERGVDARWMKKANNPLVKKWGVTSFPSVYVVNKTGVPIKMEGSDRETFTEAVLKHIKDYKAEHPLSEESHMENKYEHGEKEMDKERFMMALDEEPKNKRNIEMDFDGRDVNEEGKLEGKEKEDDEVKNKMGIKMLVKLGGGDKRDGGVVEMDRGGGEGGREGRGGEGGGDDEREVEEGLGMIGKVLEEGEGVGLGADEVGGRDEDGEGAGRDELAQGQRMEGEGMNEGAKVPEVAEEVGDRSANKQKALWDNVMAKNREKAKLKKDNIRMMDQSPNEWPNVYMLDLESAIQYSLRHEVSLHSHIEGEALQALTNYVAVLHKYFPARRPVAEFLESTHQWLLLRQDTQIPIEDWLAQVDPAKKPGCGLSDRLEWIGCHGSEAHLRGYPCGLWTLFHTLTVSQASLVRRYDNASFMEVLNAMKGYILSFFSCLKCRENFSKEVADVDSVSSFDSAILWLWKTHNRVNKRLRGDPSEDPEHPKISFPPREICVSCYASTNQELWEELRVLVFMKEYYSLRNFDFTNLQTADESRNDIKAKTLVTINPARARMEVVQRLRKREMDVRLAVETKKAGYFGLGINGVDLSMCMVLNISCIMLIVFVYFILVWRRRRRTKKFRLLP